jgi:hypothetical protein
MENLSLKSLTAPGNLPACGFEKIYAVVCGIESEAQAASEAVLRATKGLPVEVSCISTLDPIDPIHSFRRIVDHCLAFQTRLLIAMPDIIYGNGSISNVFNYARHKPVTVAAAHVRVNERLFAERYPGWFEFGDNRTLVRAAFECGAVAPCDTHNPNVTRRGGISWTRLDDNTRLLIHHLPAPWLCWFTPSDVEFWKNSITIGDVDHVWPSSLLAEQRFRVIGSTDVFFGVEMESSERGGELQPESGSEHKEEYFEDRPSHRACGCFLIKVQT